MCILFHPFIDTCLILLEKQTSSLSRNYLKYKSVRGMSNYSPNYVIGVKRPHHIIDCVFHDLFSDILVHNGYIL